MKFLQQLAPQLPLHETAKAEKVEESSVIRTLDSLRHYSARDIADFAFFHFLILFIMMKTFDLAPAAAGHASRTTRLVDFKKFTLVGTDLYMYLHILFGGEHDRLKKSASNALFFKKMNLSPRDTKSMLLDIAAGRRSTSKENRFLLALEKNLQIETANYRSVRRIVQNWDEETTLNQKLAVTRLLQAVRSRSPNSDLLVHLEALAKDKRYEIKDAKNPEVKDESK